MPFEPHSGYVEIAGERLGCTLSCEGAKLLLEVHQQETAFSPTLPEAIDVAQFVGTKSYFTLLNLFRVHSSGRLGVGMLNRYEIRFAIREGLFNSLEEVRSASWLVYIEDIYRILHVTGFQQTITLPETGNIALAWFFTPATATALECPSESVAVHLGQDCKTSGDQFSGPSLAFRYPARLEFAQEVGLDHALRVSHRVRLFFSLMMGRLLDIEEFAIRVRIEDQLHSMDVYGLRRVTPSLKPDRLIGSFENTAHLAQLLDTWLLNFERLQDAIHLHCDGLEQRRLSLPLRFQLFVQAIEALHRRTISTGARAIDRDPIIESLRARDIAPDVIDRVSGTLAHAHEPGLRQRLRHYWNVFADEIATVRPNLSRGRFVSRVAATRNYYAHGLDRDEQVLEHEDLWNHTELLKVLSHLALLREIGVQTQGIGASMLHNRFAEFSLNS